MLSDAGRRQPEIVPQEHAPVLNGAVVRWFCGCSCQIAIGVVAEAALERAFRMRNVARSSDVRSCVA